MKQMPLRYNISAWKQAEQCLSNTSRDLHIRVTNFINNCSLEGTRISVEHDTLGVLFSYLIEGKGDLILEDPAAFTKGTTKDFILRELRKFGFFIYFNPRANLELSQISYLMTLRNLGYDRIRWIRVRESKHGSDFFKFHIVGFNLSKKSDWLNYGYTPSLKEFENSLVEGTAINLDGVSVTKKFSWDWLDYVANIDDILRDNQCQEI